MFEKLVWAIVEYYAHKYVRGFRPEAMKIDLWNGRMVMNNVELNTSELEALNLPVHIKMGYIHQLSVEIPWSRILSDSVHVKIHGLEIEVIPNHCYKPSNVKKEIIEKEISSYLSILSERILDNLVIDIDLVKVSFCDYGGSFPSTIWITFKKIYMINKKDPIQVNKGSISTCEHCTGNYKWSNTSTIESENREVRKEIIIEGMDIYLEEYDPNNINIEKHKSLNKIDIKIWYDRFKKESVHSVLQNLSISIGLSIDKLPFTHLHFCYINCDKPIEIHLRDKDLQAFLVMMNELKHILFKKYEGSKSNIDSVRIDKDDIDIDEDSEGMFTWMGSTFSRFTNGWFNSTDPSWEDIESINNEEIDHSELNIDSFEELPDIELTEEERKKLEIIQSEIEKEIIEPTKVPIQQTVQKICVHIKSIKCYLIQHIEFPDYISHKYYVTPRPLIRIVLDNLTLRQLSKNQQTRFHFSLNKITVEDNWNVNSLFREIFQSPISSFKKKDIHDNNEYNNNVLFDPALHIHFFKDSRHDVLPSLQIKLSSIQVACPPDLIKRIISFCSVSLPNTKNFIKKKSDDNILLNDISNMDLNINSENNIELDSFPSIQQNSISIEQPQVNTTSISIKSDIIRILFSSNFEKKDSELLVLDINNIQYQQLVQFQQQQTNNIITSYNGYVSQICLYTSSIPSYICNSTTGCFHFIDPIDIEIGVKTGLLSVPSSISPSYYCKENEIASYNSFINFDFTISPINCYINPLKIEYLLYLFTNISNNINQMDSNIFNSKSNSNNIIQPITCIWQPLYGTFAKNERKENLKDEYSDSNIFFDINISCPQFTCIYSENLIHGTDVKPIISILIEDTLFEICFYKNLLHKYTLAFYSQISSYSILDYNSDIIMNSGDYSPNNMLNTGNIYATPLYTSLPFKRMNNSFFDISIDSSTPLRESINSLNDSLDSIDSPADSSFYSSQQFPNSIDRKINTPINSNFNDNFRRHGINVITINGKKIENEINLDINISQCNIIFNLLPIKKIIDNLPKFESKNNSITLSKGELLWKNLYLKSITNFKQKFKKIAVKERIPCLLFNNWESFMNHSCILSTKTQFINNNENNGFTVPIIHLNISNIKIETIDHSDIGFIDISIPNLSISTLDNECKYSINTIISCLVNIPHIQIFMCKSNYNTYSEESILTSGYSSDENDDDLLNNNINNSKISLLDINEIIIDIITDFNPIIDNPFLTTLLNIKSIKSSLAVSDINMLLPILQNNISQHSESKIIINESNISKNNYNKYIKLSCDIEKLGIKLKTDGHVFCKLVLKNTVLTYTRHKRESILISLRRVSIKDLQHIKKANYIIKQSDNSKLEIICCKNNINWNISGMIDNYNIKIIPSFINLLKEYILLIDYNHTNNNNDTIKTDNSIVYTSFDIYNSSLILLDNDNAVSATLSLKHLKLIQPKYTIKINSIILSLGHKKIIWTVEQLKIILSLPLYISLESFGSKIHVSTNIISTVNKIIKSIKSNFKSKEKLETEPIKQSNIIKESKFSWIFNKPKVYFCDINEKELIEIKFLQFQILKLIDFDNNFFSLSYSNGEILLFNNNIWISVVKGYCESSKILIESYRDIIKDSAASLTWDWKKPITKIDININILSGNLKELVHTCNHIKHIISNAISNSTDNSEKQIIAKPKGKQINTKEYSISIQSINLNYNVDKQNLHNNSSFGIELHQFSLSFLIGKRIEYLDLFLHDFIIHYKYKKLNDNIIVNLLKLFGVSTKILQTDSISDAQIVFDCTGLLLTVPLCLLYDFKLLLLDIIGFSNSIKNKRIQIKEDKINNQFDIIFSNSVFSRLSSPSLGYIWKADNTLVEQKSIIWTYNDFYRIRKICWNNENSFIRCSVVSLQYFDETEDQFIDLYSPIEYNCSITIVDIDINSKISSKKWKLIFHKPLHITNNESINWPWISLFRIYSDKIKPENDYNQNIISKYTAVHIKTKIGQLNLRLSSSTIIKDNIIINIENQLISSDILISKYSNTKPLQINGFIQSSMSFMYQDYASISMKYFLHVKPFIHFIYSNNGKLSFNLQQQQQNNENIPIHLNASRSLLQLFRNIISYINNSLTLSMNNDKDDIGMFYHFKFYNYTGLSLLLTELYNNQEFSNKTYIDINDTLYWKWSIISDKNRFLNKENSERRIKICLNNIFESSLIDISIIGTQSIKLYHKERNQSINILIKISYSSHEEEMNSTTINIKFISSFKISNELSIPLDIMKPSFDNSKLDLFKCYTLNNNESIYLTKQDLTEKYILYYKVSSSSNWEVLHCKDNIGFHSNLIFLRKLTNHHEQYSWINYNVNIIDGFKIFNFTFSPVYILKNYSLIKLRFKIITQNICISEGIIDPNQSISLYHSLKRKTYLQLSSGCVPNDSTEWSPFYELTTIINNNFNIKLDSGIGITHGLNSVNSLLLDICLKNTLLSSNIRTLEFHVPYKITNLTNEGIFIAQVTNEIINKQIYIPPNYKLPFSFDYINNTNSFISIFDYISGKNISKSLRNIANIPKFQHLIGVNPQNINGIYNAGFCVKEDQFYKCNQYLVKLNSFSPNNIEFEIYSPFIIENLSKHTIIIDVIWPTEYKPNNLITIPNNNELLIKPGKTASLHHWISSKEIIYSGNENISFLIRYDSIGWLDEECNLEDFKSNKNKKFILYNSLTKEYSKLLINIQYNHSDKLHGQHIIRILKESSFLFNFINYTYYIIYILIKETNEEIEIYPCTSIPLDIEKKLKNGISIAIRMTKRHRWSDYIVINRQRNILLSLFGPKGSESIKIIIKFKNGCSYINFCCFKSKFERNTNNNNNNICEYKENLKLGYNITKSTYPISIKPLLTIENLYNLHLQQYSSNIITNDSNEYLSQLFPNYPGMILNIKLPSIIITICSEDKENTSLLNISIKNTDITAKYYKPQCESIKFELNINEIIITNCLSKSHYPLRWGECTNNDNTSVNALSIEIIFPILYNKHIDKISVSLGFIYLQLTGPFVSKIVKEIPAWISALKYPTCVSKSKNKNNIKQELTTKQINNMDNNLYINEFQIESWNIEITWANFASQLIPIRILPKNLLSVSNLRLNFSKIRYYGFPNSIDIIKKNITNSYTKDFILQLFPSLGSIDILGNPTHMGRQIRYYIYSYLSNIKSILFNTNTNTNNSILQDSSSLIYGILSAIIDCSICFNSVFRDIFYSIEYKINNSPLPYDNLLDSASETLKLFLNQARISLEEAMRNTVSQPIEGYYSNGTLGLYNGSKRAISGWAKPCRAGLDINIHILTLLRNWLLESNSLPQMKTSHICNSIPSLTSPIKLINSNTNLWNNDILQQWENKIQHNDEIDQCIFPVKKLTSQYNTILYHDRILLITNYSLLLSSANSLVLAIPLIHLQKIINDKTNFNITIYYKHEHNICISKDSMSFKHSDDIKYIQLHTITELQHSSILFHILSNTDIICETKLDINNKLLN